MYFYPRYSNPLFGNGHITIVNNNGSNIRTTVSLTKVIDRIALLRFSDGLHTSTILRHGLCDLPGIGIVADTLADRIGNSKRGIANLICGSHSSNRFAAIRLRKVFIRVNLLPGAS